MEHLKDARKWLEHSKNEKDNHRVACAMAAHSMIQSLNQLFERYFDKMPGKHRQAVRYFKRLIKEGHIDEKESKYTHKIQNLLQKKSDADYKAVYFSKKDADKWKKQAKRIYEMAEDYLKEE